MCAVLVSAWLTRAPPLASTVPAQDFRLDEQIEKHTGAQTSAKSLTWSYAETFNALLWRGKAMAAAQGRA